MEASLFAVFGVPSASASNHPPSTPILAAALWWGFIIVIRISCHLLASSILERLAMIVTHYLESELCKGVLGRLQSQGDSRVDNLNLFSAEFIRETVIRQCLDKCF